MIVSHAPRAGGYGQAVHWGDLELGGWAVGGFFAISGWLITGSRLRLGLREFLWRRCLRIYPGYWVALVVTAVVLAPLSTVGGGGAWHPSSAFTYIAKNLTLKVLQGGIVGTAPHPWNLSLWTLSWEFACYLGIGLLLGIGYARRRRWPVLAAFLVVVAVHAVALAAGLHGGPVGGLRLVGFFLAGAVAHRYADRIPVERRLAAVAVVVLALLWRFHLVAAFGAAPLAYVTLYAGARLPLSRFARRNDISYGVYVYGYPVQLLLALAGATRLGHAGYTFICIVAVVPFAAASWFLVERPALLLKHRPFARTGAEGSAFPPAGVTSASP